MVAPDGRSAPPSGALSCAGSACSSHGCSLRGIIAVRTLDWHGCRRDCNESHPPNHADDDWAHGDATAPAGLLSVAPFAYGNFALTK